MAKSVSRWSKAGGPDGTKLNQLIQRGWALGKVIGMVASGKRRGGQGSE